MALKTHLISAGGTLPVSLETLMSSDQALLKYDEEVVHFAVDRLTDEQLAVYRHIEAHPQDIVLMQAGPGSGKTFTLKTITYHNRKNDYSIVIFKHDLLEMFAFSGNTKTVAAYIMRLLGGIGFSHFKSLDMFTNSNISPVDFGLCMCSLMQSSRIITDHVLILDEYTVISKPFLVLLLIMNKYRKVGTIICGDRDQLQCIRGTNMMKPNSSYELASIVADRTFALTQNLRTDNVGHAELIVDLQRYSSPKRLDEFACIMLCAQFMPKLFQTATYNSIHLAGTHRELAMKTHSFVVRDHMPVDYYMACSRTEPPQLFDHPSNQTYLDSYRRNPNQVAHIVKYLPYVPLNIGSLYYVRKMRENELGTLIEIHDDHVVMEMRTSREKVLVSRSINRSMPDAHATYVNTEIRRSGLPYLNGAYAFDIYPYNFMSVHKCQGMTLLGDLDIDFNTFTYQGMYVAVSRVRKPEQIVRVTVANQLDSCITAILNIRELCALKPNTYLNTQIIERQLSNYIYYRASFDQCALTQLVHRFAMSTDTEERIQIQKELSEKAANCCMQYARTYDPTENYNGHSGGSTAADSTAAASKSSSKPNVKGRAVPPSSPADIFGDNIPGEQICENAPMLAHMLENRDLFLALATIEPIDRILWLKTYAEIDTNFVLLMRSWTGCNVADRTPPEILAKALMPPDCSITAYVERNCEMLHMQRRPTPGLELLMTRGDTCYYTTPFRVRIWTVWMESCTRISDMISCNDMIGYLNDLLETAAIEREKQSTQTAGINGETTTKTTATTTKFRVAHKRKFATNDEAASATNDSGSGKAKVKAVATTENAKPINKSAAAAAAATTAAAATAAGASTTKRSTTSGSAAAKNQKAISNYFATAKNFNLMND